ncbi:APC family permease [Bailinhaonella thermotolerans]|uniref:APC family permease n=1 Tax=Bailinhaonella thermotolerans TaxID=1070861 RepID=A0A3A4A859_9ACTN|nr:APC family permease [Bailinhaonella thermotolerans]RJL23177.1 APC family permease [Bailinhaonella thermotolerans]
MVDVNKPPAARTGAPGLQAGSVGLGAILMQAITQISPTLGIFYTIAFTTGQAAGAAPLTYLVAFAVCLALAVPLSGLARHLPSAGGFYTYVSRGLGPRAGFITGWLYAVMVAIVPASLAAFTGGVLHDALAPRFGIGLPWYVYALAIMALCWFVAFRGIALSMRLVVALGLFEIAVGLGLALTGVLSPGPGGVNLAGFNPATIPSSGGFFLAIVLSIFAFTGFESAATLAEESSNPARMVPRAIVGSLALIGAFYVVCAWGLQIGWGTDNLPALASSSTAPAFVLADRVWGAGWLIILIALVNSGIGVCIACTTSATRTLYGMARSGALPGVLARVHPARRTPHVAIAAQTGLALAVLLAAGLPLGPFNLFNTLGVTGTYAYIVIFTLANAAAWRYFRTQARAEFSPWSHAVLPLIATVALAVIGWKSFDPMPDWPVRAGPLIAALYLAAGLALLAWNLRPRRRGWMASAGELPDIT